ncbi:hypothetical protein [Sphingomonas sp. T9W2]|uniref:hypothetical protein n=1 Tax=Sphingomonas sp. T9W2 TaxID=3143183 RepID=UPI0031F5B802
MLKIAFPARLSAALLMLCACFMPAVAVAQTGTGSIVTSLTRIPDTNADGVIKLDGWALKVSPKLPRKTTVYGPCPGLPDFSYRVRQACVEVTAPPVIEPPVVTPPEPKPDPVPSDIVTKMLPEGGVAIQRAGFNVAFGPDGGLGTTQNVGAPFLTDTKSGFLRLSMYTGKGDDVLLHGRSQDIAGMIVNGRYYVAGLLHGYRQMRGVFSDPFTFSGETVDTTKSVPTPDGIKIVQRVTIEGTTLFYRVRLTNARSVPVSVTYFRSEDPDTAASYATQNRVVTQGRWEAGLTTGETYFIETTDAGAYAATNPYDKAQVTGTRREIGYDAKVDLTLQLVWPAVLLAPGESTEVTFRQGVK